MPTFDFYNPQIQPLPSMSLGDVMNIANSAQAYKSGQIALQQQQQKFAEQQAVANAIRQNPDLFMDENGRYDQTKINSNISRFAPTYGADLAAPYINLANAQTGVDQARTNLTQDKLEQVSRPLATLANNGEQDPNKYKIGLNNMLKNFAGDAEMTRLVSNVIPIIDSLDPQEGPVSNQVMGLATHLSTPTANQMPAGQTVNLPSGTFELITKRVNGKPQMALGNMIAPAQAKLLPDPDPTTGAPRYEVFNYRTNSVETTTSPEAPEYKPQAGQFGYSATSQQPMGAQPPVQSTAAQPPAQAPVVQQLNDQFASHKYTGVSPAKAATIEQGTALITKDREIAPTLPQQTDLSNQIIGAALKTPTGGGAGILNALSGNVVAQSALGVGSTATDLQTLGHNLALLTSTNAQNSGLGTDAGRQLAGEMSGNLTWTPQAIIKTARMNRALTHATRLLINGRQGAVSASGDAGAASDFSLKWGKTAKLDAIRLMDAYENRNQDPDGFNAIVMEFGGNKSARYKQALKDSTAIETLVGQ